MGLIHFAWRQIWRGAAIWAALIAVIITSGVTTYNTAYADPVARQLFVNSVAKLPALQALYGQAVGVETVGGFLAWRYGDIMTLVVGLWALLAVTRILRGDEEAMRAEVLVASPVTPRRLLAEQLAGVALGCALVFGVTALVAVANGLPVGGSVLFAFMVASGGLLFGALAAVTSQLFDTRRRAAGWAGALLGLAYLLRAVGDGSTRVRWIVWLSPLGWAERIEPYTGGDLVPVVIIVVVSAALVAVALVLRERRDTGAGIVGDRADVHDLRPISSPLALDWRTSLGALKGWGAALAIEMFVLGYLTKDVVTFVRDSPSIDEMVTKMFGFSMGDPEGYVGLTFTVAAMVFGVYVGTHLISARDEEACGRADHLLVGGVGRARWLGARVVLAVGAMTGLALVSAVAVWMGAIASGASISLVDTARGALNVVPVSLLYGGLAVATFGAAPRATSYVVFGSVALSYVLQVVGGIADVPHWVLDLSPLWHVAPVPASGPNIGSTAVFCAVAALAGLAGFAAFGRRDVASA